MVADGGFIVVACDLIVVDGDLLVVDGGFFLPVVLFLVVFKSAVSRELFVFSFFHALFILLRHSRERRLVQRRVLFKFTFTHKIPSSGCHNMWSFTQ